MSRIGKKFIKLPEKVSAVLADDIDGTRILKIKGPLGEISRNFRRDIDVVLEGDEIKLSPTEKSIFAKALWGTYGSHIKNMIDGVTRGYKKSLQIEGIGYKVAIVGDKLVFNLGFSHQVEVEIPAGIKVTAEKNNMTISGFDKELVGKFSAGLVDLRKPEPYKGKGIRYEGQIIKLKQGKKIVA